MDLLAYVPVFDPSGYSELCRNMAIACDKVGINVVLHPRNNWSNLKTKLSTKTIAILNRLQKNTLGNDFVTMQAQLPDYTFMQHFKQAHAHFIYSMFETDRAPVHYPPNLNNATETFVPSYHVKRAFNSSHIRNVSVIRPAMDTQIYMPRKTNALKKYENMYKFFICCDLTPRKGLHILLSVFFQTFANRDDVVLIVKAYWGGTSYKHKEEIVNHILEVKKRCGNSKFPMVVLIGDIISEEQMAGLFNACDCYVAPSFGEGFNLPVLQAMACGKPVIATDWSGHEEFISKDVALPLGVDKIEPVDAVMLQKDFNYANHLWAVPNALHLARLMKWCYENREKAKKMGEVAREYVIKNFNYEKMGLAIKSKMEQYKRKEFF